MLVARQQLHRAAYEEAEETLAPLTDDRDRPRAAMAWAWIAVARQARGDRKGALVAAKEALLVDKSSSVALEVVESLDLASRPRR